MSKKYTYFVTGGGTGGHIYPAIAVADELLQTSDCEKVYYVGNPDNLEFSIVKDKPYEFLPVHSFGMPRKIGFKLFCWVCRLIVGWLKCCFYVLKYKPDVIFGTGGYVSAPVLLAGMTMRIPFVMHDCDANPGLVTRKISPFAKSVSLAFEVAKEKLKNPNCRINGNPIRKEFLTLSKSEARKRLNLEEKLTLCIMGGSQGAKTINDAAASILSDLSKTYDIQVIFQTGKKNFDNVISYLEKIYPEYKEDKNIIIKPYFDDMVTVLKACDIAVSRAGSLSISELCASSVAPIFVPYPYAAADHQRKNAKYMVEQGAGFYLEDSKTNSQTLLENLELLINHPDMLNSVQQKTAQMAKFDGVSNIVKQIQDCR
jgi:UDP-N-acetylglucosamine--N-acetylmuramyl-(pentapeptide) pyrophosphoryl-undecaprenol N-acetylglucosamine transferase